MQPCGSVPNCFPPVLLPPLVCQHTIIYPFSAGSGSTSTHSYLHHTSTKPLYVLSPQVFVLVSSWGEGARGLGRDRGGACWKSDTDMLGLRESKLTTPSPGWPCHSGYGRTISRYSTRDSLFPWIPWSSHLYRGGHHLNSMVYWILIRDNQPSNLVLHPLAYPRTYIG